MSKHFLLKFLNDFIIFVICKYFFIFWWINDSKFARRRGRSDCQGTSFLMIESAASVSEPVNLVTCAGQAGGRLPSATERSRDILNSFESRVFTGNGLFNGALGRSSKTIKRSYMFFVLLELLYIITLNDYAENTSYGDSISLETVCHASRIIVQSVFDVIM